MRPPALLFLAALVGSGAAWFTVVLPLHREAAGMADELEKADIAGARERARAWAGPSAEVAARLEEALNDFTPPVPTVPLPSGLQSDRKGGFTGQIHWTEVQGLLAWVADQPRPVNSLEVQTTPGSPDLATCRIALGPEKTR